MRNHRGFTLIELVIVIVILGILGAIAAPRFLNLQGDAYRANLDMLKNSIETAAKLGHTKAILNGYDKKGGITLDRDNNFKDTAVEANLSNSGVQFIYGYPQANGNGIIKLLMNDTKFGFDKGGDFLYTHREGVKDYSILTIAPRARHIEGKQPPVEKRCELTYEQPAKAGQKPIIQLHTKGC